MSLTVTANVPGKQGWPPVNILPRHREGALAGARPFGRNFERVLVRPLLEPSRTSELPSGISSNVSNSD